MLTAETPILPVGSLPLEPIQLIELKRKRGCRTCSWLSKDITKEIPRCRKAKQPNRGTTAVQQLKAGSCKPGHTPLIYPHMQIPPSQTSESKSSIPSRCRKSCSHMTRTPTFFHINDIIPIRKSRSHNSITHFAHRRRPAPYIIWNRYSGCWNATNWRPCNARTPR